MTSAPLQAREAGRREYAIPAGSLTEVLKRFGVDSGLLLSFSTTLTAGQHSPGLHGRYTTAAGLRELFQHTGLEAVPQAGGGYLLRKAPAPVRGETQLAPVTVTAAAAARTPTTEHSGSYTTRALTLGKMELSIRETPQSVTVVTRQQMNDQNLVTIEDVVAQTAGAAKSQRNFGSHTYILRGFQIPDDNYLLSLRGSF